MSKNNISCLTSFQKQEYTRYLQSQLEKFSGFILNQKKQNERYRLWEQTIMKQNQTIVELENKVRVMSMFQTQSIKQQEKIKISTVRIQNFESRINKLQNSYLGQNNENKTKRTAHSSLLKQKIKNQNVNWINQQQIEQVQTQIYSQITQIYNNLSNRIKQLEKFIRKNIKNEQISSFNLESTAKSGISSPIHTHYTSIDNHTVNRETQPQVNKKDLKKLQKKLKKMIQQSFTNILTSIQKGQKCNQQNPMKNSKIKKKTDKVLLNNANKENNFSKLEISSYEIDHNLKSKSPERNIWPVIQKQNLSSNNSFRAQINVHKPNHSSSPLQRSKQKSISKNKTKLPKTKKNKKKDQRSKSKSVSKSRSISKSISNVSDISRTSKISKKANSKKNKQAIVQKKHNHKHKSKYDNLDSVKEYLKMCKLKH